MFQNWASVAPDGLANFRLDYRKGIFLPCQV